MSTPPFNSTTGVLNLIETGVSRLGPDNEKSGGGVEILGDDEMTTDEQLAEASRLLSLLQMRMEQLEELRPDPNAVDMAIQVDDYTYYVLGHDRVSVVRDIVIDILNISHEAMWLCGVTGAMRWPKSFGKEVSIKLGVRI